MHKNTLQLSNCDFFSTKFNTNTLLLEKCQPHSKIKIVLRRNESSRPWHCTQILAKYFEVFLTRVVYLPREECVSPNSLSETTFLLHEVSLLILPQYEKQKPLTVNIYLFIQQNRKDITTGQLARSRELGALWKYLKKPAVRKKATTLHGEPASTLFYGISTDIIH